MYEIEGTRFTLLIPDDEIGSCRPKDEGFHLLTGKRFKLSTPTLALETLEGKRVATTVPAWDDSQSRLRPNARRPDGRRAVGRARDRDVRY